MSKFTQVLLETADGLFGVSVPDQTHVDERRWLVNPVTVFETGSVIVAVKMGDGWTNENGDAGEAGLLVEQLPPWEQGRREPTVRPNRPARFGIYRITGFTEDGRPQLRGCPPLGELTP
jgi:hypothetical protein